MEKRSRKKAAYRAKQTVKLQAQAQERVLHTTGEEVLGPRTEATPSAAVAGWQNSAEG